MAELLFANLNILLKLDYYDITIIDNLIILLKLHDYGRTIICEFKYFIKVRLL
jgi:hypothetical protein